jgi:hypothetical protein
MTTVVLRKPRSKKYEIYHVSYERGRSALEFLKQHCRLREIPLLSDEKEGKYYQIRRRGRPIGRVRIDGLWVEYLQVG